MSNKTRGDKKVINHNSHIKHKHSTLSQSCSLNTTPPQKPNNTILSPSNCNFGRQKWEKTAQNFRSTPPFLFFMLLMPAACSPIQRCTNSCACREVETTRYVHNGQKLTLLLAISVNEKLARYGCSSVTSMMPVTSDILHFTQLVVCLLPSGPSFKFQSKWRGHQLS